MNAMLDDLNQEEIFDPCDDEGPWKEMTNGDLGEDLDGEGLYSDLIRRTPLLTADEEIRLAIRMRSGGPGAASARTQLIEANQRLVLKLARYYRGQGLDFADLVQEGNVGLIQAIDKFDTARGHRFSTHAIWWIRQAILRSLENFSRTIRLPTHVYVALMRLKREESRLGFTATDEEVARAARLTIEQLHVLRQVPECSVSLYTPLDDESDFTLGDTIANPEEDSLEEKVLAPIVSQEFRHVLEMTLTPREWLVICQRFDLDGQGERHLHQVGREIGRTHERVRQIEMKALRKLRAVPQLAAMRGSRI